jgi:hypothetical protein
MAENLNVFDFALTDEEMARIAALKRPDGRIAPELHARTWQALLDGTLVAEGTKEGKSHDIISLATLPRLQPDVQLSRLTLGGRDEFTDVRVRRASSGLATIESADVAAFSGQQIASGVLTAQEAPDSAVFSLLSQGVIKKAWREHPSKEEVEAAMDKIAEEYPPAQEYPPDAPRPAFDEIWTKLKGYGDVTRRQAEAALTNRASHLRGRRGRHSTKSPI